jgi:hypothetical protein
MNADAKLQRVDSVDKQTLGEFIYQNFSCKTIELGWHNNEKQKSCIPKGTYKVIRRNSAKYGEHFHITEVPNRSLILIHNANYARELLGCVGIGDKHTDIDGDGLRDVTNSKNTLRAMLKALPKEFLLEIC